MPRSSFQLIADPATIPVPVATASYMPVPQNALWKMISEEFKYNGFTVSEPMHMISPQKTVFVSSMNVSGRSIDTGSEIGWTVAGMSSYNRSIANRIVFGGKVFICANGLVVADKVLKTKHTTNVFDRLPNLVRLAVSSFREEVLKANEFYNDLKTIYTAKAALASFAVDLGRADLLPKAKVVDFVDEATKPSYDYGTEQGCLWNVHNAYTHFAKDFNPTVRPSRVIRFEKALKQAYALV
jgi:hypothetical protein